MGAVPRPPAGLADRIKNDIPNYLQPEPERARFSRSVAFSMRVAASILLLITSVFVTLNLIEPAGTPVFESKAASVHQASPAVMRTAPQQMASTSADTATQAPAEEIRLEISEEPLARQPLDGAREAKKKNDAPAPAAPRVQLAQTAAAPAPPPAAVPGVSFESNEEVPVDRERDHDTLDERITVAAEAPVLAYAPEPAAASASPAGAVPQARSERAASGLFAKEAIADGLDLAPKKNVFGIAVDPEVFHRIKTALESGERPAARSIDIEALVNYFAGAPLNPPNRGLRLEVEASPAPDASSGQAVLRFTIDTQASSSRDGESLMPAARDAHLEIVFNSDAVADFHRVGDSDPLVGENVLLTNTSVTGLFDLQLRPRLKSNQRIATVTLRYRSVSDGKSHTIERAILGRDLVTNWAHASRRHRLASLGAVWGESLKQSSNGADVAKKAEELVTQNPKDPLARELAHAAASAGGGGR
jgi:hypothetical protein